MSGVLLSNAAPGDERNVGKRATKGANIAVATYERAGKELDEIGTCLPTSEDFSRGHGAGHHDDVGLLGDKFNGRNIEPRAANELSAGVDATASGIDIENGTGADDDVGDVLDDVVDDIDGTGNGHGYLDERDAALRDLMDGEASVFGGRSANDGNQPNFFDASLEFSFFHHRWPPQLAASGVCSGSALTVVLGAL